MEELLKLLKEYGTDAQILAGGTEVLILIRDGVLRPKVLLDIWGLRSKLSYVKRDGEYIRIGALTTFSELCSNDIFLDYRYAGFAGLCHWFAVPYIRNVATVGGNLATGHSYSDFIILSLALDAEVKLLSVDGERWVPVRELYLDKRKLNKKPEEFIAEVRFRELAENTSTAFMKFDRRTEHVFGYAVTAVYLKLRREDKVIEDVRIAFDRVSRRVPDRAYKTEEFLRGKVFTKEVIAKAMNEVLPSEMRRTSDFRASGEYRLHISKILMKRALYLARARILKEPIVRVELPITEYLKLPE